MDGSATDFVNRPDIQEELKKANERLSDFCIPISMAMQMLNLSQGRMEKLVMDGKLSVYTPIGKNQRLLSKTEVAHYGAHLDELRDQIQRGSRELRAIKRSVHRRPSEVLRDKVNVLYGLPIGGFDHKKLYDHILELNETGKHLDVMTQKLFYSLLGRAPSAWNMYKRLLLYRARIAMKTRRATTAMRHIFAAEANAHAELYNMYAPNYALQNALKKELKEEAIKKRQWQKEQQRQQP